MKKVLHIFPTLITGLLLLFALQGHSQDTDRDTSSARPEKDTLEHAIAKDTLPPVATTDTLYWPEAGDADLSTTLNYGAKDSMVMDVPNRKVFLYGNAEVEYGDVNLTAAEIAIDYSKNMMTAKGRVDSTGKYIGRPYFKQGDDEYVVDSMGYNMESEKAILYNIVTEQDGGYVSSDGPVKRTKDAVYIKAGRYTTCNLAHPHFYIKAHKLKIIPEKEIISGPFHMVISDIPTPIGFPLGFFPIVDKGKSGVIFPTIGENRSRGFFLSRGGYYFKIKEKMGVSLLGDFYSNGSTVLTLMNTYKSRYHYDGNFAMNFSRVREGYGSADDNPFNYQYNVRWTHNSSTTRPGKFSANVNMSSSSFYSQNSYDPTRVQSNAFNSAVSYNRTPRNSIFNYSISLNQDQNSQTKVVNFTLPNVSVNMNRVYPFRRKVGSGNLWYEKINTQVTGNASYKFSNYIKDYENDTDSIYSVKLTDSTFNESMRKIFQNGTPGARFDIPVSATFNVLRYFNLTPTFSYTEYWYAKRFDYHYDAVQNKPVPVEEHGFFRTSQYNFRVGMNTWVYGKWKNRGKGMFRGVLHSINPIVAYQFTPDFSQNTNNYQRFPQYVDGQGKEIPNNRYAAAPYGSPSPYMSNLLSLEIRNIVEAKIKRKKDTVNVNGQKIKLLENLSMRGSFDFTKDSLKMSYLDLNARTRIYGFDINFNSRFDPYIYIADTGNPENKTGIRMNRYAYSEGQGLARLDMLNFSVTRSFVPKKGKSAGGVQKLNGAQSQEAQHIINNPYDYVDFNMPWALNVTYAYGFVKNGLNDAVLNQSMRVDGNVNLTKNWKLQASSSYDIVNGALGYTTLSVFRDLHCWQASFNCVPFGSKQSYFFTFTAKSTLLQDLKLNKRSPGFFAQNY